jgi:catechol 2,3-dioxygenase-like lactoylglutathione lyase family enzyme
MTEADVTTIERITPILRARDALRSAEWYGRLGFEVAVVHQFEPDTPRFLTLRAGDLWLFLSEHEGDATPDTLVYVHVADVDAVAGVLGERAEDMPWGMREFEVADPDGNRVRIGAGAD